MIFNQLLKPKTYLKPFENYSHTLRKRWMNHVAAIQQIGLPNTDMGLKKKLKQSQNVVLTNIQQ